MNHENHKICNIYKLKNIFIKKISNYKRRNYNFPNDITIIASNCSGGIFYHNYNKKFNSPFINLFIYPDDFYILLRDFNKINLKNIKFIKFHESKHFGESINFSINKYPIAILDSTKIELHFMHDKDENAVLNSWYRRCERINFDKILFILDDRRKINEHLLIKINALEINNLIYFSCQKNYKPDGFVNKYIWSSKKYLEWDWINKIEYYLSRGEFNEIFNSF